MFGGYFIGRLGTWVGLDAAVVFLGGRIQRRTGCWYNMVERVAARDLLSWVGRVNKWFAHWRLIQRLIGSDGVGRQKTTDVAADRFRNGTGRILGSERFGLFGHLIRRLIGSEKISDGIREETLTLTVIVIAVTF